MKNIDSNILYELYTGNDTDDYIVIEDTIVSSDSEDGGADHEIVIQNVESKKFYMGYYTDWDLDNYSESDDEYEGRCDFDCNLHEVFPKQVMTTIYVKEKSKK